MDLRRMPRRCGIGSAGVVALLVASVLGAALVLPPRAAAATAWARIRLDEDGEQVGPVRFIAARGERNRLVVAGREQALVFRDAGARVTARGDCRQLGLHAARC